MTEDENIDREREWLLRQRDNGLTHDQIVALIGGSRSAVTKNLNTIDDGGNLAMPLRRKIIAYLDRQEREAAERRQAAIDEEAERKRAVEVLRRQREIERIRRVKRAAARQGLDALKAKLKNLEAIRLRALREVNEGLEGEGIDTGGRIHGDGVIYARTLEEFQYADPDAEHVAFVPDSHKFPGGWTGRELREGVSAEQRRSASLVPKGEERPEFIGIRSGNMVTVTPYPDDPPFWGELLDLIDEWQWLFRRMPSWWKEGKVPQLPDVADVAWYEAILEVETDLLSRGICFEQSIIDWGDDWRESLDGARAVVDDLRRRSNRRVMVEGLTHAAFKLRWVALTVAALTLVLVFWDVFVWDVLRSGGDLLLAVATVIAKCAMWVFLGLWWLLKGLWTILSAVGRAVGTAFDKIVWFLTSPWLILATGGVLLASLLSLNVETGGKRSSSSFGWLAFAAIISGFATLILLIYWLFNAPFPEIEKLFPIP